jgi:hypothetical protein
MALYGVLAAGELSEAGHATHVRRSWPGVGALGASGWRPWCCASMKRRCWRLE